MQQLTLAEIRQTTDLDVLEPIVERGQRAFVEVGVALMQIRDSRAYVETHSTFDRYCKARWGWERAHPYRLMEAAKVAQAMSPMGDTPPINERQARELAGVPEEERVEVYEAVLEKTGGKPTAKAVKQEKASRVRAKRMEQLAEKSVKNKPLPVEKRNYPVILADPPWQYDDNSTDPTRQIENQYPTMSHGEICKLPVRGLADDDALLFLWATSPMLKKAMATMSAWGFEYKTCAVWDKTKIGMGYFFRQQHELMLVGERGSMLKPEPSARPSSVVVSPRGKHSEKPAAMYEIIERMYPGVPKIELFARSKRSGWDAWGNES